MNSTLFETSQVSLLGDRRENQDRCSVLTSADVVLLIVADGMGGHPKGDEAAELVVDTCQDAFMRIKKPIADPAQFLDYLSHEAHQQIVGYGESQTPPIDPRTTMVVGLVQEGLAWWGHIGDSRLYHFHNGSMANRTIDHSYVEKLLQDGLINEKEMENHPFKNYVTRCLGGLAGSPDLTIVRGAVALDKGDTLVLCSDGFWGPMGNERLTAAFDASDLPLDMLLRNTANMALYEASPSSDNVTAVALRWLLPAVEKPPMEEGRPEPAGDDVSQAMDRLRYAIDSFEIIRSHGGSDPDTDK